MKKHLEFLATNDMIKMTFRGGDACGLYRNSKEEERGRHLVRRAAVKNGEREEIFLGCLGELLPSLQVQKKKKKVLGLSKRLCIKCPDAFQNRSVLFPAYKSWNRGKGSVCKR